MVTCCDRRLGRAALLIQRRLTLCYSSAQADQRDAHAGCGICGDDGLSGEHDVHQGQHLAGLGAIALFDGLLDEPERGRVLDQGADLRAVQA